MILRAAKRWSLGGFRSANLVGNLACLIPKKDKNVPQRQCKSRREFSLSNSALPPQRDATMGRLYLFRGSACGLKITKKMEQKIIGLAHFLQFS